MTRKTKAWLVTWEWSGDHAKRPGKVAEVLDPRMPPEQVRRIVERLYAYENYTLSERISWCVRDKSKNPYPATFIVLEGLPWRGQIVCGHNPWLLARLVDDLTVEPDEQGKDKVRWTDRYKPREIRAKILALKKPKSLIAIHSTENIGIPATLEGEIRRQRFAHWPKSKWNR